MGQKPLSVAEFQFAPYTNASTGTVGTWTSFPRRKTINYTADAELVENVYDGGRDRFYQAPSGTLTGTFAGVPLAAIAAVLGLTLTVAGTGATLVETLDIPLTNVPPLGKARWRQVAGDGGDQTVTADGVRFSPAPSMPANANEWTDTTFSAVIDGNDATNKFIQIQQRATAAAFS